MEGVEGVDGAVESTAGAAAEVAAEVAAGVVIGYAAGPWLEGEKTTAVEQDAELVH